MEDLSHFHVNFIVPIFRSLVFRVVFFFYILIYRGLYALSYYDLKANIQEEKTIFKMAKSIMVE